MRSLLMQGEWDDACDYEVRGLSKSFQAGTARRWIMLSFVPVDGFCCLGWWKSRCCASRVLHRQPVRLALAVLLTAFFPSARRQLADVRGARAGIGFVFHGKFVR
ncbi:hypothetical protein ACU4GD_08255 [Cupriavidus basilensis]